MFLFLPRPRLNGPDEQAGVFTEEIAAADRRLVGAPTLVAATAVMLARKGRDGVIALDALGKGVGSPRVLNYGDVLSYGVARSEDEPLLFKGEDFPSTDITPAQR